MKITVLTLSIILCSALGLRAQSGGTSSFGLLNVPAAARVAAMGGNYISMKDGDLHLASMNPAAIDSNMSGKLASTFVDYFDKIRMGSVVYGRKISAKVTAVGTLQYANYGKQTELDALGYELGEFNAADYSLTLGAGYQLDTLWSLGANFRTIYSALANYSSLAVAVDAAATYYNPKTNFTAALVLRNAGFQIKTYLRDEREKLPFEMQIGITKRLAHAPFRFSIIYENLQKWDLTYVNPNQIIVTDPVTGEIIEKKKFELGDLFMRHIVLGTEFILTPNFNLRIGYNYRRRQELKVSDKPGMAGFSLGAGFKISRFYFSYGRSIFHLAGPSNHFSITTNINQW